MLGAAKMPEMPEMPGALELPGRMRWQMMCIGQPSKAALHALNKATFRTPLASSCKRSMLCIGRLLHTFLLQKPNWATVARLEESADHVRQSTCRILRFAIFLVQATLCLPSCSADYVPTTLNTPRLPRVPRMPRMPGMLGAPVMPGKPCPFDACHVWNPETSIGLRTTRVASIYHRPSRCGCARQANSGLEEDHRSRLMA